MVAPKGCSAYRKIEAFGAGRDAIVPAALPSHKKELPGCSLTEVSISTADKRLILTALAVVLLLSALDQSIVSTAMPRIIEQLHGLEMYAWVTTAYLLTSTVSVPIYGKLSDLYGRKPILVIGVLVFLLGSALCGLSGEWQDMPVLGTGMTQLIVLVN